jgi:TetR/AcrR family transcriptional regulator, mexJK operon transcriptional repressor
MATTTEPEGGRSARKRKAIITAAREAFLSRGFKGVTMDEIAATAAVSKRTVYQHFSDKQLLFTAIITGSIDDAEQQNAAMLDALPDTEDLEVDLRRFARAHVADVLQPHLVRLRRVVIAEAERFPDLARTWYESGPERGHATLAEIFEKLAGRGWLRVADPLLAAQHFNWLVLSIPLNRAMFRHDTFTADELDHYADEGVRVFLAAYGAS